MDLPKFLAADDADTDCSDFFLVHTQAPRFIARLTFNGTGENAEQVLEPHWIDQPDTLSDADLRALMTQASAYVRRALDE